MIILLRGHIRNSFDNDNLYNLMKRINNEIRINSIYIHSWNIQQNSLSWREIQQINKPIDENYIKNYFKDLAYLIKLVLIDDDSRIKLLGKTDGIIPNTAFGCPLKGWKNLWYANYKLINYVNSMVDNKQEFVLNTRFDILSNSFHCSESILNFLHQQKNLTFEKCNNFITTLFQNHGIDNIIVGNITTMKCLLNKLYNHLDYIILERFAFKKFGCQEYYVYHENFIGDNFDIKVYKKANNIEFREDHQIMNHWIDNHMHDQSCIQSLPEHFNIDAYRTLNGFHHWNEDQLLHHYINHGRHENRPYNINNFDPFVYKLLNNFDSWTNQELTEHYINHGQYEKLTCSLPEDFNIDMYRLEKDLTDQSYENVIIDWLENVKNDQNYKNWHYVKKNEQLIKNILYKILVYQTDNRPNLDYLRKTQNINKSYCKKLNWYYLFEELEIYGDNHPAVYKIMMTQQILENSDKDFIIFLDSDAWIHNPIMLKKLIDSIPENKHGVFSRDPYMRINTFINSGSFILRINEYTRNMYKEIINHYINNREYHNNWPYDQYYISDFVYNHKNDFCIFKPNITNCPFGRIIRHSWHKNFSMCHLNINHDDFDLKTEYDTEPFPNTQEVNNEYTTG